MVPNNEIIMIVIEVAGEVILSALIGKALTSITKLWTYHHNLQVWLVMLVEDYSNDLYEKLDKEHNRLVSCSTITELEKEEYDRMYSRWISYGNRSDIMSQYDQDVLELPVSG